MRWASAALVLIVCEIAAAQNYNILESSPPTALYVATAYEGNDGRQNCDWYLPATEISDASFGNNGQYGNDCIVNIIVRGIVNRAGLERFVVLIERLALSGHQPATIILNSKGGDADVAIDIGNLIRANELFQRYPGGVETTVSTDDTAACFSACVVIYAAGYRHSAEFNIFGNEDLPSRIGIHGPGHYDANSSAYDSSSANVQLQRIATALKIYFADLGVNEQIVDDMYAVPFDEIRLLTRRELSDYGIIVD